MTLTFEGVGSPEYTQCSITIDSTIMQIARILPGSGTNKIVSVVNNERSPSLRVCSFMVAAVT